MLVKCFNRGDGSYRSISLALKGTTQMPRVRRPSPCARRGLGLGHTEKLGGKFLSVLRAIPASPLASLPSGPRLSRDGVCLVREVGPSRICVPVLAGTPVRWALDLQL